LDGCSESLFQTLELGLLHGRWLSESNVASAQHVAVINQTMATQFFAGDDPVGKQFQAKAFSVKDQPPQDVTFQIIGVLRDVKNFGPQVPVIPMAFIPYTIQGGAGILFLKSRVPPASLMHTVREQVWTFDRDAIFAPEFGPYKDTFYRLTYSRVWLVDVCPVGGHSPNSGRHWRFQHDGLYSFASNSRNRGPHGARCVSIEHLKDDPGQGSAPNRPWHRSRNFRKLRSYPFYGQSDLGHLSR
jgi:hypothetical protein